MPWVQLNCSIDAFRLLFCWFCNRDVPVTTEGPTDAVHEQDKLEAKDNSEKKAKDTNDVDENVMIAGH